jgi:hypothetical protein
MSAGRGDRHGRPRRDDFSVLPQSEHQEIPQCGLFRQHSARYVMIRTEAVTGIPLRC